MRFLLAFTLFIGVLMASSLPKYESITLENGMQVVVIPLENNTGVVSTDIFYKVGSRNETMGKTGIAHMLEHMNFKSTKNLKAGEFDREVKSFGGINNASTSFDYTHYFIKSSTINMPKSIALYAELMQNLELKEEEFAPERDVVAEERRWRSENSPMGYLYFSLFNTAYDYHPYHWTPIGFMNDIQTWSLDEVREFHTTYYQPQNAILLVTGDVKADEVFELAKKEFGGIKNRHDIPSFKFVEPEQKAEKRITLFKDSEVEFLAIAYHIPNFLHKDQVALSALSEILYSGKSSRLYEQLVEKKHLANSVYAFNMQNIDPGLFIILATCNPDVKATDIEDEILKEIGKIKNEPVSQDEIDKLKINTKAEFIYSLESSLSVADLFGSFLVRGDLSPLLSYEADLEALDAKTIQEVASRYFRAENSTTIILKKGEK